MSQRRRDLFFDIIHAAFCGESFNYKEVTYKLKPKLVEPRDFIRNIEDPSNHYERLMTALDPSFKASASHEMYRSEKGWIAHGIKQKKIRKISFQEEGERERTLLLPVLSPQPTVGIDSSGIVGNRYLYAFCFFEDASAGYTYLEKHICIRKPPSEFKFAKLRLRDKIVVRNNLLILLKICCRAVLLIDTDILNMSHYKQIEKAANLLSKVFDGCFSGGRPERAAWRNRFHKKLFSFGNGVKVHCDSDFGSTPRDVVDKFIRVLSKNGEFGDPDPTHSLRKSHESEPIQVADIIVGVCRWNIQQEENPPASFSPLWFNNRLVSRLFRRRKMKRKEMENVQPFYWLSQEEQID